MLQSGFCFWAAILDDICISLYNTAAMLALYRPKIGKKPSFALFFLTNFLLLALTAGVASDQKAYLSAAFYSDELATVACFVLLWRYFEGNIYDKMIWYLLRDGLDPISFAVLPFQHFFPDIPFASPTPVNAHQFGLYALMLLWSLFPRGLFIILFVYLHRRIRFAPKAEKSTAIIAVVIYCVIVVFLWWKMKTEDFQTRADIVVPLMLVGFAVITVVFFVFAALERRRLSRELAELTAQKQAQYELFMTRLAGDEETSRLRHDMNGHLAVLKMLLHDGEYERAQNYLEEISANQISLPPDPPRMENAVAGALIADKYLLCQHEDISFTVDGSIHRDIGIADVDIVCLLSNLLDNAIEACEKVAPERRRIYLKLAVRASCLFIRVENSKSPARALKNGRLIETTKVDSTRHGYGGRIIQEVVDRYDGALDFSETSDSFTAIAMLHPSAGM